MVSYDAKGLIKSILTKDTYLLNNTSDNRKRERRNLKRRQKQAPVNIDRRKGQDRRFVIDRRKK